MPDASSAAPVRRKLIEVSIPLEAINAASAREKSIRHGHPSTLHLWWARRPLAACRAVLFAQLVDDPSSWPGRYLFPDIANDEESERRRLHKVIEAIVPWEASNNETVLNAARWEIARSVAWGLGEEPPPPEDGKAILDYLQAKAPPVYDPFSGGGSIPLEAQRLGLRAYGSDLNPVAVLIGKALVEIPPKFAGLPPVNPEAQAELKRGGRWNGKGAQGLAEDVRYYGRWMRDEAEKRIGHLYPKTKLPDGSEATVIAWLWARTVRSPDPMAKGAMVPLLSTFFLCNKTKKSWLHVERDAKDESGWRFVVCSGLPTNIEMQSLKAGTVGRKGAICALTQSPISLNYIRSEGRAGRIGFRLAAIVAEGPRGREYITPTLSDTEIAEIGRPELDGLNQELALNPRDIKAPTYGMTRWIDLFSNRQLLALETLCKLVQEVRERVTESAYLAGLPASDSLAEGGKGARAYGDAVATYLGFGVSRLTNRCSTLSFWDNTTEKIQQVFGRQAIPMVWDFAEANVFSSSSGNFLYQVQFPAKMLDNGTDSVAPGSIINLSATELRVEDESAVFSTDPPYYDNIPYAELSDFFYVWLRKTISGVWPELFRRLQTPKAEELVASPVRHGSKTAAEDFFMKGMSRSLSCMRSGSCSEAPTTIYYAFKQSEDDDEGITSAGWSSFLQAVIDQGFLIDGTWPIRTELTGNLKGKMNALASSIVLVCRKRSADAAVIARADFVRALKRELPGAIEAIRKAGVGPVDMQQSVIGPGMGVFSRNARVLEDDDSPMTVKTALALINRAWEEIENELDGAFDAETQVALAWYAAYGFDARPSGELITLATAKNTSDRALFESEVFENRKGKAALRAREDLPADWTPEGDKHLTVWECAQHVARALNAEDGGTEAAARLVAGVGSKSADARKLVYRLFEIATQKGWPAEALVYNELAGVWPKLEELAADLPARRPAERDLFAEAR